MMAKKVPLKNGKKNMRQTLQNTLEEPLKKLKGVTQKDSRLKYRDYIKEKFQTMKDQNLLPDEYVLLNHRYSKLKIIYDCQPEKEGEHEIMTLGWKYAQRRRKRVSSSAEMLFKPDKNGLIPQIVVLQGAAGIGKTTTVRKTISDWACGQLYQDKFDYVFYIHCREMNLDTEQSSIVDMISKQEASEDAINEILWNPKKVLFIIDGFDELRFSINLPEDVLCSDPWKKEPMEILLSSLLQKKVLPGSYLIITTRPAALKKLCQCVDCPRHAEILGFSEEDRMEYFHKFFQNEDHAEQAFRTVKKNETLFTMCSVPLSCWIICTVLKQQMERGADLGQTSNTLTAVYILYLSSWLKLHHSQSKQFVQGHLRALCSMAAEGVWKREILFREEEIKKHGVAQKDSVPIILNDNIFRRDVECSCVYSFIHLSFQEFFAALFYLLEEGEASDSGKPIPNLRTLLESYMTSRPDLELTVRFLFGLLNEIIIMKDMKESFGLNISPRIKEFILQWVKNATPKIMAVSEKAKHALLECLYEIQDGHLVESALDHVSKAAIYGKFHAKTETMALAYCLEHCRSLEVLELQYCSFIPYKIPLDPWEEEEEEETEEEDKEEEEQEKDLNCEQHQESILFKALRSLKSNLRSVRLEFYSLASGPCVPCEFLASLLSIYPTLSELDLNSSMLTDSNMRVLAEGLKHPDCKLQKLWLYENDLTAACCGDLASVLCTNQNLRDLDLSGNALRNCGIHQLCQGLKHPNCRLQNLRLSGCSLQEASCGDLAEVLIKSETLKELDLRFNELGSGGLKLLCKGLKDPKCKLEMLMLISCKITGSACGVLSSTLKTNQMLKVLDLRSNELKDSKVKLLCKGLKHQDCKLQMLSLFDCGLTADCCEDLSSFFIANPILKKLDLSWNVLGDSGVKRICEGLRHPDCRLQSLTLSHCSLTQDCCGDLAKVLSTNQWLEELDVSWNKVEDTGIKLLCDGLSHPDCKLETLELHGCGMTPTVWEDLVTALTTNHSLTKLHIDRAVLGDSGRKLLCDALKSSSRKQQTLWFNGEEIGTEYDNKEEESKSIEKNDNSGM